MTAKEKAKELKIKFMPFVWSGASFIGEEELEMQRDNSRECALICVNAIIDTLNKDIRDLDVKGNVLLELIQYWKDVKKQINNL